MSFAMIGTAGRQHVTIDMPIPTKVPQDPQNIGNRTYTFTNVRNVRIENATVNFVSLSFQGENCLFEAKFVDFYGHIGPMSAMVSAINITCSRGILKNCTIQHNCFIRVQSSAVLTISDCAFHSYNHAVYSAVALDNSTIELAGSISFINNTVGNDHNYTSTCGAAISINSRYGFYDYAPNSVFNITGRARVDFLNNTAASCGGAIYLKSTMMSINMDASMILKGNAVINHHHHLRGGAMYIEQSLLRVREAEVHFSNNFILGMGYGGAFFQIESNVNISDHAKLSFVNNRALHQGGAVFLSTTSYMSVNKHSKLVFSHNSADQGGALYLQPLGNIKVGSSSYVEFSHNEAETYGGAVYVDGQRCLFIFSVYSRSSKVLFKGNFAKEGVGMHIYGASVKSTNCNLDCNGIVSYAPNLTNSLSPVSSSSKRVCLCDSSGKPQCAKISSIFLSHYKVYRGESFNISAAVVGYDFGVTRGTINAGLVQSKADLKGHSAHILRPYQYHQWTGNSLGCSNITYNFYYNNTQGTLYLHSLGLDYTYGDEDYIRYLISFYERQKHKCADIDLLTTPVFINITLLNGCPPGFTLTLKDQLYGCNCYPVLQSNHFKCFIIDNAGYLKWNSTMWVNVTSNKYNNYSNSDNILLAQYCPLNYCKSGKKVINLGNNPNAQCAFNRAGILCGGCKDNYSLAIGSSHCIKCSSDVHLLLITFFLAAGFLLVIFILVLNLTVTQGLINGVIFYANILWTYKDIIFPSEQQLVMKVLQVFIAWLNLDFGIETCFVVGLTAFWKTWLQFLFPLYIWLIAGVIIIVCRYSSRLTNIIGDRAVPLLATLFLLSYTKLLRTVKTILEFGVLARFPNKITVWYLDGNLTYYQHPHIYLFIAAMVTLVFCLSFTFFLLLIQCWRRISHLRLLRWINKFTPFYDAYFASLRNKHHYWFGTLLLVRGALLVVFTATSSTSPFLGLLILLITLSMLQLYMSIRHVHKFKLIRLFESISLLNLLLLVGCTLYTGDNRSLALQLSTGFAFVQFFAIIVLSIFKICCHNRYNRCTQRRSYNILNDDDSLSEDSMFYYDERVNDPDINPSIMHHVTHSITHNETY